MDYKQKYLKYKEKYLQLKKILGGSSNQNPIRTETDAISERKAFYADSRAKHLARMKEGNKIKKKLQKQIIRQEIDKENAKYYKKSGNISILIDACEKGNLDMVKKLIKSYENNNMLSILNDRQQDSNGSFMTPLMVAVR